MEENYKSSEVFFAPVLFILCITNKTGTEIIIMSRLIEIVSKLPRIKPFYDLIRDIL